VEVLKTFYYLLFLLYYFYYLFYCFIDFVVEVLNSKTQNITRKKNIKKENTNKHLGCLLRSTHLRSKARPFFYSGSDSMKAWILDSPTIYVLFLS